MNRKTLKFLIILILFLVGCAHKKPHDRPSNYAHRYIDGVNLFVFESEINDVDLLIAKHIRAVRLPIRYEFQTKTCQYIDKFLSHGVTVLLTFDLTENDRKFQKAIDFYLKRYGNRVFYEIFNEPWAYNGNPGYKKFDSTERIFVEQTRWIDYIHSKCPNCKTLNGGIADFCNDIEMDLLLKYVERGHQDIFSIHIYGYCENALISKINMMKKTGKKIWITEIGTTGNKENYINTYFPNIVKIVQPEKLIWFDYNSGNFGIEHTDIFNKLFE